MKRILALESGALNFTLIYASSLLCDLDPIALLCGLQMVHLESRVAECSFVMSGASSGLFASPLPHSAEFSFTINDPSAESENQPLCS